MLAFMILGSGLTPTEQAAFGVCVLIKFFEGEDNAERKALVLCSPFSALAARRVGLLSDDAVSELVMEVLMACLDNPEVEYCWGERRDQRRDETRTSGTFLGREWRTF
jgi:hypothetical protein